jgi:hypothetical protein
MGTAVGTKVFIQYGWRAAAAVNMAWLGWQLFILLLRGPHCDRWTWFGYQGGLESKKSVVDARKKAQASSPETNGKNVDLENGGSPSEKAGERQSNHEAEKEKDGQPSLQET